ncbi:MAG: autotransporter-associated beta strand repeat-containing protein [Kiritimatiellaeota bacterium]|nr:autotransporter-associated beta strand repeat-containing protein [Kiritimatiellota bacterium]
MDTKRLTGLAVCGLIVSHAGFNTLGQSPVNYLTATDGGGTSSFIDGGAKRWTDGQDPHPGADYVVPDTLGLRTPEGGADYTFKGDSLTMTNGSQLIMKGTGVIAVNDLRFCSTARITQSLAANTSVRLDGAITVLPTTSAPARFGSIGGRTMVLTGTILGTGDFRFNQNDGEQNVGGAFLDIDSDLSGFEGVWRVENPVTDFSRYFEVRLSANDNIGSALSAFRPDAITLVSGGGIAANGSVNIGASLNRGITLQDGGAFAGADASSVLTIGTPVTGTGSIYKRGPGRVELDCGLTHDGGIFVESGALRFGHGCTLPADHTTTVCGGVLEGWGDFGNVVVEIGSLSPGDASAATSVTVSNLTFAGGSAVANLYDANVCDCIHVTGLLTNRTGGPIVWMLGFSDVTPPYTLNEYCLLSAPNLAADFTAADFFAIGLTGGYFEIREPAGSDPELVFVRTNDPGGKPVNYLTASDPTLTSSFIDGGAKHWTDGLDPHPSADYIVTDGLALRSPENNQNYTFKGDSLTVIAANSVFTLKGSGTVAVNDLRLGPGGRIVHGVNSVSTLDAGITILPTASTPFRFHALRERTLTLKGTVAGTGDFRFEESVGETIYEPGGAFLNLDADLSGFEGVWGVANAVTDFSRTFEACLSTDNNIGSVLGAFRPDAITLINGGGLTAASSKAVTVGASLNRGITLDNGGAFGANSNAVLIIGTPVTGTGDLYKRGPGRVELDCGLTHDGEIFVESGTLRFGLGCVLPENHTTTVRGTGVLEGVGDFGNVVAEAGALSPGGASAIASVTASNLTFDGGIVIADLDDADTCDCIRMTGLLTNRTDRPIRFDLCPAIDVPAYSANEYTLLSAPNLAADFTADDFALTYGLPNGHFEIREPAGDDPELVFVSPRPFVRLVQTDVMGSSSWNGAGNVNNWSDKLLPTPGKDYLADAYTLRTPEGSTLDAVFGGNSLTIGATGQFLQKCRKATVDDLRFYEGGCFSQGGTANEQCLDGNVAVFASDTNPVIFQCEGTSSLQRTLTIDAPIRGEGALLFRPGNLNNTSGGGFYLTALNDGYCGKIAVNGQRYVELGIWDERNLGGLAPAAPFNPDHLTLMTNAILRAMTSLTISNDWRGIRIMQTGTFSVADPDTLTLATPICGDSINKIGAGTLVLSGDNTYSGTTTVSNGTLAVESVTGLGTSALCFSPGTALRVTYPCALENGFLVSGSIPLVIDDTLTLSIEATEAFPTAFTIPLFFVEEEADIPLGDIVITGIPSGYITEFKTTPIVYSDSSYTAIALSCRRNSTVIMVR